MFRHILYVLQIGWVEVAVMLKNVRPKDLNDKILFRTDKI